jgi:hypothetical protein
LEWINYRQRKKIISLLPPSPFTLCLLNTASLPLPLWDWDGCLQNTARGLGVSAFSHPIRATARGRDRDINFISKLTKNSTYYQKIKDPSNIKKYILLVKENREPQLFTKNIGICND